MVPCYGLHFKKTPHLKEARGIRDGSKDLPSFTSSNGASSCCLMGRILYIYTLEISSPCPHMVQDKRVKGLGSFRCLLGGSRLPCIYIIVSNQHLPDGAV